MHPGSERSWRVSIWGAGQWETPLGAVAVETTLAEMIEEGFDLGVALIACQSGLHLMGVDASTLDPRIAFGGPVSLLQTLDEDRLLIA